MTGCFKTCLRFFSKLSVLINKLRILTCALISCRLSVTRITALRYANQIWGDVPSPEKENIVVVVTGNLIMEHDLISTDWHRCTGKDILFIKVSLCVLFTGLFGIVVTLGLWTMLVCYHCIDRHIDDSMVNWNLSALYVLFTFENKSSVGFWAFFLLFSVYRFSGIFRVYMAKFPSYIWVSDCCCHFHYLYVNAKFFSFHWHPCHRSTLLFLLVIISLCLFCI